LAEKVVSWANESLVAARAAYQGIQITGYDPGSGGTYPVAWEGEDEYRQRCGAILSARMSAAASNLALLLDTIWPS
jgi:hypothetical protein